MAPDRDVTNRDLASLPKAHLHLHLEGAMRPSTLVELADVAGLAVPAVESAKDFTDFIALYVAACRVLLREEDMFRLFREVAEDAAASGARWIEVHANAGLHVDRFGPEAGVFELQLAAAKAAEAETGVGVGIVVSADRTLDPAISVQQAHRAAKHADDGVVAFGLANDESFPPEPFAEAFAIARAAGLISAPHAGELAGAASVRGALDALHAERLGHGVRAVEEPALVQRLAGEGVCCDVCPSSNLALHLFESIETHPVRELLAAGVPVTLNSDDPLMFGSTLVQEYELVREGLRLDDAAMAAIARTSIERSAMPASAKRAALADITTWLA